MNLPKSTLIKKQKQVFKKDLIINGDPVSIVVNLRYDDECENGHNTFSITGKIYEKYRNPGEPKIIHKTRKTLWLSSCGCLHEKIEKYFPELRYLIKWHLVSSDGPMHYVANAKYWKEKKNKELLHDTIVYGAIPYDEGKDPENMNEEDFLEYLNNRLPALMKKFKEDIEALGFDY